VVESLRLYLPEACICQDQAFPDARLVLVGMNIIKYDLKLACKTRLISQNKTDASCDSGQGRLTQTPTVVSLFRT
jgi:hypothetical protein